MYATLLPLVLLKQLPSGSPPTLASYLEEVGSNAGVKQAREQVCVQSCLLEHLLYFSHCQMSIAMMCDLTPA